MASVRVIVVPGFLTQDPRLEFGALSLEQAESSETLGPWARALAPALPIGWRGEIWHWPSVEPTELASTALNVWNQPQELTSILLDNVHHTRQLWTKAKEVSEDHGLRLREHCREIDAPVVLVCHSLGCRVGLLGVPDKHSGPDLHVIAMAAAIRQLDEACSRMEHATSSYVVYSKNDMVLRRVLPLGENDEVKAIGLSELSPFLKCPETVQNEDATKITGSPIGHFQYAHVLPEILDASPSWKTLKQNHPATRSRRIRDWMTGWIE